MSTLITPEVMQSVEENILRKLNGEAGHIVSALSMNSTRAIGDAVQEFLADNIQTAFPSGIIKTFEGEFGRRSMEDMAFYDRAGYYQVVDVKTHHAATHFNMPNLISVKRLSNFYKNPTNVFNVLIIKYDQVDNRLHYTACHFLPIEHFNWDCLTIGALGWGQIQIANANSISIDRKQTRRQWMISLCDRLDYFYEAEIGKIRDRETWSQGIRRYWEDQPE